MTGDQILLFALFAGVLGLLLWGRLRHDLVAMAGLLLAVVLGLVPEHEAFSGFSNEAVLIVAFVLIASRAFENSGALGYLARGLTGTGCRTPTTHIAVTGGFGAALSAVINNVAALALLMPLDIQEARKAGRPPSLTLMPLAFATILGGMATLIGTPPNIVASAIRAERLGEPYRMFDFAPVGLTIAVVGILFVALIGWRLVPRRGDPIADLMGAASFKAELVVPEGAPPIGRYVADLDDSAEAADVLLVGLIRSGNRHYGRARHMEIAAGDILIVEGSTEAIGAFIKAAGVQLVEADEAPGGVDGKTEPDSSEERADVAEDDEPVGPEIVEAVVHADSRLIGRTALGIDLRQRFGLTLLGMKRAASFERERVRDRAIRPGDVLLLAGGGAGTAATLSLLGLMPVSRVDVSRVRPSDALLAFGLFAGAIAAASFGIVSFAIAIAIAVTAYVIAGLVPVRELYEQVEWPVVVMLACLLPIGSAFEAVGGTALIAESIVDLTEGYSPVVALVALMVATMCLSDALNNVATIVIAGPLAIDLAQRLGANPDTFLMGVAIAASCAFLTPIGHKNNLLIMGPGSYRFSDYWRMGLPLEIVVLAVGVPMLMIVWPL